MQGSSSLLGGQLCPTALLSVKVSVWGSLHTLEHYTINMGGDNGGLGVVIRKIYIANNIDLLCYTVQLLSSI